MNVYYEWRVEYTDADGDIEDSETFDSYAKACNARHDTLNCVIVLVRDADSGRSWAYMNDGVLPAKFQDAYGVETAKVPAKYVKELS